MASNIIKNKLKKIGMKSEKSFTKKLLPILKGRQKRIPLKTSLTMIRLLQKFLKTKSCGKSWRYLYNHGHHKNVKLLNGG